MKHVWLVLGGSLEFLSGVFATREAARIHVRDRDQNGPYPPRWYKVKKIEVQT